MFQISLRTCAFIYQCLFLRNWILLFFPLCGAINLVSPKLKTESSLVTDSSLPVLLFLENCLPMPPSVITSFLETDDFEPSTFPFSLFYDQQPSASADGQFSLIEKEGDCAVSVRIRKTKPDKIFGTVSLLCDKCGVTEGSLSQLFWCGPRQFLEGNFLSFLNSLLGASNQTGTWPSLAALIGLGHFHLTKGNSTGKA